MLSAYLLLERLLFFSEDLESEDLVESLLREEPELLVEAADLLNQNWNSYFFSFNFLIHLLTKHKSIYI